MPSAHRPELYRHDDVDWAVRLRAWRQRHGYTRRQAALRLGVRPQSLDNWENRRRVPRGPLHPRLFALTRQ